jgi:hypothetical protein
MTTSKAQRDLGVRRASLQSGCLFRRRSRPTYHFKPFEAWRKPTKWRPGRRETYVQDLSSLFRLEATGLFRYH